MKQRHSHSAGPRLHLPANRPAVAAARKTDDLRMAIFTALTFRAAYVAARPEFHTFAR
jgi:hypothetical protein